MIFLINVIILFLKKQNKEHELRMAGSIIVAFTRGSSGDQSGQTKYEAET